jgi:hypothetical protein
MARIQQKWVDASSIAQGAYEFGVNNPRTDWGLATAAAEANYTKGVQSAIQRGAFGKGVKAAGAQKWKDNALRKGATRFAEGVRLSTDAYAKGFQPYADVIARTSLPARGPKGDPGNINRVAVMAKALHDAKLAIQGK